MSVFYVPAEPRPLCLELSDDRTLPLQCRFKRDHEGEHDWQIEKTVLMKARADQLRVEQGTPSDVLPRRVPGEALRTAEEAAVSEFESEGGTPGHSGSERAAETNLARRVIGRWSA